MISLKIVDGNDSILWPRLKLSDGKMTDGQDKTICPSLFMHKMISGGLGVASKYHATFQLFLKAIYGKIHELQNVDADVLTFRSQLPTYFEVTFTYIPLISAVATCSCE